MVTVTNKEIYNKLLDLENHVLYTNGKVRVNRWMATTAIALITIWIGCTLASAGALL